MFSLLARRLQVVARNSSRARAVSVRSVSNPRANPCSTRDLHQHLNKKFSNSVISCVRLASNLPATAPSDSSAATDVTKRKMEADSPHFLPKDQKVVALSVNSFDSLPEQAKLYAHYLSKASWYGGLIVLHQVTIHYTVLRSFQRLSTNGMTVLKMEN